MAKQIYITTPFLKVLGAWTSRPDEYQGEVLGYKLKLETTPEIVTKWKNDIFALVGPVSFKAKNPKIGVSEHEDGTTSISPKSKYKPTIVDAKNRPLQTPKFNAETGEYTNAADDLKLGSGSVVRAICALNVYDKGISLQLQSIQVKTLVEWSGKGGFDVIEDEEEGSTPSFNEPVSEVDEQSALDI